VTAALATTTAATFVWLGMVLAVSFLEAPLKFRAPGVTIPIGLGIGRLVFRALNSAEVILAVAGVIGVIVGGPTTGVLVAGAVAVAALVVQLVAVRPPLNRRSDTILAGEDAPHSRAHHAYIALEAIKVVALFATGIALLAQ
jgi:hypothetical protein